MARAKVSPSWHLAQCPAWPTSHTLPRVVTSRVEAAMWKLRGTGRPARVQDVVGIAIVLFTPSSPSGLIKLLTKPHPALRGTVAELPTGRYRGALRPDNEQLMLRMPSPVTLRLNALVDELHRNDFRSSRRQVVSALILHSLPQRTADLSAAYDRYVKAPAKRAAVKGRPVREVLALERPKPGRRSLNA